MTTRKRERRFITVAGAAALVAVGLNLAFSAVAAHRRRKRRGERPQKPLTFAPELQAHLMLWPPQLHKAMRARPPSVKSSQELELEELEKAPKFKAKPLNKKILESKGDIGVFAHPKPLTTAPKEFHFSIDDRLGPPAVTDLFDKLSLYSESSSQHNRNVPRVTIPNPFNLHTEERGHLKDRQLAPQLLQKQIGQGSQS